jgi:hypothetical protein
MFGFWVNTLKLHTGTCKCTVSVVIFETSSDCGQNTLGAKLKTLSQELELSKMYTNHCLRATTITLLDEHGFEARHSRLQGISGV